MINPYVEYRGVYGGGADDRVDLGKKLVVFFHMFAALSSLI
jgi:hypothetical protein